MLTYTEIRVFKVVNVSLRFYQLTTSKWNIIVSFNNYKYDLYTDTATSQYRCYLYNNYGTCNFFVHP
jgi:hypothetical protein